MEAGNSLEQATALVAAANKVVQDPSSVGSALRTISLRLRGTSVEILEEMGEETDGVVESTSKLQEKLKALTGVDILTDAGAYKDTYTILREIGEVWEDLDPMDQAAALELMAGKNRANTLAAILNNMEDLKGAYETALGAEGSAMRENAAYLDSIQGRIDLFNNSLQTMWMNFLNADAFKFIVDLGTGLLKLVDNFGLIETALAAVMGYFTLIRKVDWTQGFGTFFGKGNKTKLLKGKALDDEMLAFNTALSQGPEAFGAYTQGAKEAGNGMDILADKVARGNVQLVNGRATSQQYTAALKSQSSAAQQAAKKQKLMNTAVMLTTMAVSGIISAIQSYADSIKTVEERYDELQSSISTIEGDINSLDSDLGTIQEQIDALSNKPLTIADAEELRKLKEQSAELQRQKELKESMLDAYKVQDEAASLEMFNQIIKTTAANQEKAAETGKTWGKVLGTIADVALVAGGIAVTGLSGGLAHAVGAAMMGAGMSGAGSSIGAWAGEKIGDATKQVGEDLESWYESYATAIEEANKKAAEAEAEYLSNVTDENYDAWQKKLEASNTLQQELYTNLEKLRGYVDGLEYNDTTKATIDGFNNLMTKISLQGIGDDAQSQISHIQSLEEEFKELSKGVDENGKNIALSADEYARYQSILSQILGLTPSLIQGYNDEGQAIVNKNNLIAESIALLQKQNKVAAQSLLLNDDSHILSSYDSAQGIYDEKLEAAKNVKDPFSDQVLDEMNARVIAEDIVSRVIGQATGDKYLIGKESLASYMVDNADAVSKYMGAMIAEFATWESTGNVDASETKEFALYLQQIIAQVDYARMATSQFKQTLSQIPQASDYYDDLSGSHLAFINAYIDSLGNLENLTDDEVLAIRDSIYMLTNAIGQEKNNQDLINSLFEVDTGLAAQAYCDAVNSILQQIVDTGLIDEDVKNNIFTSLIPDHENLESMLKEVKDKLKDEYDSLADDLSFAELKIAYKFVADKEPGSVTGDELEAALVANIPENLTIVSTYSELIEQVTSYNEILQQTSEYINNNTKVSKEYKDSLENLGISKEDVAKCFDDENELIVTNSKLLNKLVKNAKSNIAANVKLAKSQAKLQYYELYKEMDNLIDVSKSTDGATLSYVDSLYEQMVAIEKTISQYSLLEAKLLGAANAYEQLEAAQALDSENDYGSKAEELVNVLAEAFNSAELGTQAAQVAIAGLIPESEIDKAKTLDEQMQQIYDYVTTGTLSKLFTIEFDDEGGISSVEMTREKVQEFTEELIKADKVFHSTDGTWDEFTLDTSIDDLDSFAKAIGVTKEVAFAYLTELEKFDINWLGGDYDTLLDQLMDGDLEYAIMKNMKDLADLEYRAAHGEFEGKESEYREERDKLDQKERDQQQKARELVKSWADATAEIEAAQAEVDKLVAEGASDEQIKTATNKLYDLQYALNGLEEPTEVVLQFASENIQAEIGKIEQQLSEADLTIDDVVQPNKETGQYEVVYTGTFDQVTLDALAGLKNEELAINKLLNGDGITTVEGHLSNIATTVSGIYSILGGKDKGEEETETETTPDDIDYSEVAGDVRNAANAVREYIDLSSFEEGATEATPVPDDDEQSGADESTSELDSKISDLNAQLKESQDKLGQMETSIETLKAEKTALEADMEAAKAEADTAIAKLTDEKAAADETIAQLTAEISTLETAMNAAKAESDAAINQLNTEKTKLETSVTELTAAKAEADATIAQLTSDKTSLETSIANANALIAQLETEKADLNTAIAESEANIEALKADKADVESDMAEAKAMLSQTETMLAEAQSALDVANTDLANANALIASLTSTNQSLESRVADLETQLIAANAAHVNAQAEKTAADATIAKLESALSAAEETIETLSAKTDNPASESNQLGDFIEPSDFEEGARETGWVPPDDVDYGEYADDINWTIPAEVDLDTKDAEKKVDNIGEKTSEAASVKLDFFNGYPDLIFDDKDPLGLNSGYKHVQRFADGLKRLGAYYNQIDFDLLDPGTWGFDKSKIQFNIVDLVDALRNHGWTPEAIQAYCQQLSENTNVEGGIINIDGLEGVDEYLEYLNGLQMSDKTANVEVTGAEDAEKQLSDVDKAAKDIDKTVTVTTTYKTVGSNTVRTPGSGGRYTEHVVAVNGTAHAQGTAHKGGSWGAPKTETALTGELGPELRVRGNRWELLGENGAEFNEVKKGDIKK